LLTAASTFSTNCFAKEYQLILWYLGASEANMEKGEMRVEANVSISPDKDKKSTTYVEVKNLNSFRSVERAIKYEIDRMTKLWNDGKENQIVKETRGFDESKQQTFSQRTKENADDYRYFPDPDLPKAKLHEAFDIEKIKNELPELPTQKRLRYKNDFGIKDEDIEVYINDKELGTWFEEVAKILNDVEKVKIASNYITSDYIGLKKANSEIKIPSANNFAELVNLLAENKLSSRSAKDILAKIVVNDESPLKIATEGNLIQSNDEGALKEIVQKIINENPEPVASFKSGKENAIMSLVGKVIKESKGSANPQIVIKLLKEMLK
jgi:aspartyl-tRNA(Asn)/glutamyl-tRNA(Gln) amidotransferase subunit B